MIHSMTGYGKQVIQLPTKKITVELKSLNSKNLDINARIPQAYREKELQFRKQIADNLASMSGNSHFFSSSDLRSDEEGLFVLVFSPKT